MATWRTYGAGVLVSAGILITGNLWFERQDVFVRGEDIAELQAGANERWWAYAHTVYNSSYAPAIPSNQVSVFITKQDALDLIKGSVTHMRGSLNQDSVWPYIYWIDPDCTIPADGAEFVRMLPDWTIADTETSFDDLGRTLYTFNHNLGMINNALGSYSPIRTIDTRVPSSDGIAVSVDTVYGVTNTPVIERIVNDEAYPKGIESGTLAGYWSGVGNWWTYNISGGGTLQTNLYLIKPEQPTASTYSGAYIRTNTLYKVKKLLNGLQSTIYFPPYYTATTHVYRTINVEAQTNVIDTAAALASARTLGDAVSWTTETNDVIDGQSRVAVCEIVTDEETFSTVGGSSPSSTLHTHCHFDVIQHKLYGVQFGYPHDTAFASGMVHRVRVYSVLSGRMAWPADFAGGAYGTAAAFSTNGPGWEYVITEDTWGRDSNAYDAYTLGCSAAVSGKTLVMSAFKNFNYDFSGPEIDVTVAEVLGNYSSVYEIPARWKWSLVYDSGEDPSAAPIFNFVPVQSGTDGPFAVSPQQRAGYQETGPAGEGPGGGTTVNSAYWNYFMQLINLQFVIIVDWNWQHMNASSPFAPETFTPEWILANTNAP